MLSSEFCPQSEKTLAVVQTLEQDKFDTGAQVVPSHPQMNGHVHTNSQNGFSKDEVDAPTMEERPSLLCADPLLAVETGCPVGIREVENQGGFSHEDIELNVDEAAGRDGSAMEKEYKNSPLASPTVCRPKPSKKLGWYLAKQKDQEHGSWPHVDVSPRCMQPHSECGINRIKINCDQVPPLASSSGDLDDLTSFDEFAHMEASSSLNFLISSSSSSDSDRIFLDEKAASASSSRSSSISTSSSSSSSSSSDCDFTFSDIEVDAEEKKTEVYRESEWQTPFQIFLSPRLESIREGTKEDSAGEVSEEEEKKVKGGITSFFSIAEAGSDVDSSEYDTDVDDLVEIDRVMYSKPQASSIGMCSLQLASENIKFEPVSVDIDYQTVLANRQAVLRFWALASRNLRRQLEKFLQSSMHHQAAMALFAFLIVEHPQIPDNGIQVGRRLTAFMAQAMDVLSTHIHKLRSRRALQIQSFWRRRLLAVGDHDHICVLYEFSSRIVSLDNLAPPADVETNHPPSQTWPKYIWQSLFYQPP